MGMGLQESQHGSGVNESTFGTQTEFRSVAATGKDRDRSTLRTLKQGSP